MSYHDFPVHPPTPPERALALFMRTGNPLDLDAIRVLRDPLDPMYEVVMQMVCLAEDDPDFS